MNPADPLLRQADTLVQTAHLRAIMLDTTQLKKFSLMREVDLKHWIVIVTIAGVFIAVIQLQNLGLDKNRQRALLGKVGAKLIQWDPTNGRRCFEDCTSFYEKAFNARKSGGYDPRFVASDPLGLWVVLNVLGRRADSKEELRFARVVGGMIYHPFSTWWSANTESRN